jgi:hypothetical protein
MEVIDEVPAPVKRNDYSAIAAAYNGMAIGQAVTMPRVYNITLFRNTLARHGLSVEDAQVFQRAKACFILRKSEAVMTLV